MDQLTTLIKKIVREVLIEEEDKKLLKEFNFDIENRYENTADSTDTVKIFINDSGMYNYTIMEPIKSNANSKLSYEIVEIIFMWSKEKNKNLSVEKPNTVDQKVFNTHLYNFLTYFIDSADIVLLRPIDRFRVRLFRMALNSTLNHDLYDMKDNEDVLRILIAKKDTFLTEILKLIKTK